MLFQHRATSSIELKFKCWSKSFFWPTISNGKVNKLETKGPGEGGGLEGKEVEQKKEKERRRKEEEEGKVEEDEGEEIFNKIF